MELRKIHKYTFSLPQTSRIVLITFSFSFLMGWGNSPKTNAYVLLTSASFQNPSVHEACSQGTLCSWWSGEISEADNIGGPKGEWCTALPSGRKQTGDVTLVTESLNLKHWKMTESQVILQNFYRIGFLNYIRQPMVSYLSYFLMIDLDDKTTCSCSMTFQHIASDV